MADWSALTRGFQEGARFAQDFRERRQLEKAREFALKKMGREDFDADMSAKAGARNIFNDFGIETELYSHEGLKDPLAFRLMNWFRGRKQKKAEGVVAVGELESPEATAYLDAGYNDTGDMPTDEVPAFADGGDVDDPEKVRERAARNRQRVPGHVQQQTESVRGADRTQTTARRSALARVDDAVGRFMSRPPETSPRRSALGSRVRSAIGRASRAVGRRVARPGALGALAGTAIETAWTPTEQYRERFGLETDNPTLWGDMGVRALGAASDLGNLLTFGAAGRLLYRDQRRMAREQEGAATAEPDMTAEPLAQEAYPGVSADINASMQTRRTALQSAGGGEPPTIDFSQLDVDPEEVPNMQTEDWRRYRVQALQSAVRRGIDPTTAQEQVNDQITRMQQKGFLSYAQQGLALQQAGNLRGAMAAYRAAYQYFPNGYDVEFGLLNHNGRQVIVGFGKDEETGQRVPGTEMIMDPERVAVLIENFTNMQAFRAWTKDLRDFNQSQREYFEVRKPLAEAQATSLLASADASALRAQADAMAAANPSAGYKQSDMRGDAAVFREAPGLQEMMLENPQQAQYLLSVMGRIKQMRPDIPPDAVASAVMNAVQRGNLEEWLQRLGVETDGATAAPRSALGASPTARTSQLGESAVRPPGFPDAVWNNALRDNGGDPRRAAAALSVYNQ